MSLAAPEFGWPSTALREGDGAVIFGGQERPLDFGALTMGPVDADDGAIGERLQIADQLPENLQWWFRFVLAMNEQNVWIGRQFLPPLPGGYVARVTVGADEGKARDFDVQFNWNGNAPTPATALDSFLISVKESNKKPIGR